MMRYKGYVGKVEFDADAKILHGEVLGIRDVVTFQADSADEVERAFRDSVDDYLAFCRERGERPDKPHSGHFVVRADSELHRLLTTLARAMGKSLNALVVEYLSREASQAMTLLKSSSPPSRRPLSKRAKSFRANSVRPSASRMSQGDTQAV